MGAVLAACRARRAVPVGSARRRQGRAARGTRAQELGRAALGRCPRAEGLIMASVKLPIAAGLIELYRTKNPSPFPEIAAGEFNRRAFAAVHVVADPFSEKEPWVEPAIDWDATVAYREHLWGLGDMFDPALAGYWGHADLKPAMDVCLAVLAANAAKIDGVKISLLSGEHEIAMRRRLPKGMRMYTGDDFYFAELIAGDEHGHSDALLGIFDAIAPAASAALTALAQGERARYENILAPCVPLSRHIFAAP